MNRNEKSALLHAGKQAQAARMFGRHVSREKACVLLLVTMTVCALPMVAGLRLWDDIPAIVETGIIRLDGADDSMPRWLVVFGVPGLFCILNLISHIQLYVNQARMTLPKTLIRILGRWGGPMLSMALSNAAIFRAARHPVPVAYATLCALGLTLLLLGSHMMDCPQDARISLRFPSLITRPCAWADAHRFAAYLWMAAGLALLAFGVAAGSQPPFAFAAALVVFLLPILYGWLQRE